MLSWLKVPQLRLDGKEPVSEFAFNTLLEFI